MAFKSLEDRNSIFILRPEKGWRDIADYIFIFSIYVLIGIFYLETRDMRDAAAMTPLIVIYGVFALLTVALLVKIASRTSLIKVPYSIDNLVHLSEEKQEASDNLTRVNFPNALKELSWSVAYFVGILYIGYFTSSFLFAFFYILVNDTQSYTHRGRSALIWAVGLTTATYVLFVYILKSAFIFTFGFLP